VPITAETRENRRPGLRPNVSQDIDDSYVTFEDAEAAVAKVVTEAPEPIDRIWVTEIELECSPN
jgi:hypothetical protein